MTPEHALTKAKIALMSRSDTAFFTTILFSLKTYFTEQVSTAATNGKDIAINPAFFMEQTQEERLFLLVHETLHVAYMHMLRGKDKNHKVFNMAADYVINLELVKRNYHMPKCGLLDRAYDGMSTEQVYNQLIQKAEDELPSLPMEDLQNMEDATGADSTEASEALQKELERLLVKAHTQAKLMGDKPGSIPGELEVFINSLLTPKLPWYRILYKYLSSTAKDDYSYKKPNKRYYPNYYLPSLHSEGMGEVCIGVDISGSVTNEDFLQFVTEIAAIFKQVKPTAISLVLFDTSIKSITKLNSVADLLQVKFVGRGGTNVAPILEHIQKVKPPISIILTDGDFRAPKMTIKTPLLWLIHNNRNFSIDYGKTIHYQI